MLKFHKIRIGLFRIKKITYNYCYEEVIQVYSWWGLIWGNLNYGASSFSDVTTWHLKGCFVFRVEEKKSGSQRHVEGKHRRLLSKSWTSVRFSQPCHVWCARHFSVDPQRLSLCFVKIIPNSLVSITGSVKKCIDRVDIVRSF